MERSRPRHTCRRCEWQEAVGGDDLAMHLHNAHGVGWAEANDEQRPIEKSWELARLVRGRHRMRDWTLDTFPADDIAGRGALSAIRRWIAEADAWTPRVYMDGPPGTGKTGLAFSACREWIENDPSGGGVTEVEFVNVRALLAEQRAQLSRGETTSALSVRPTGRASRSP
jgi:DNA replication protein DnaC